MASRAVVILPEGTNGDFLLMDSRVLPLVPCQTSGILGRVDAGDDPPLCSAPPGRFRYSRYDPGVLQVQPQAYGGYVPLRGRRFVIYRPRTALEPGIVAVVDRIIDHL